MGIGILCKLILRALDLEKWRSAEEVARIVSEMGWPIGKRRLAQIIRYRLEKYVEKKWVPRKGHWLYRKVA